MTGPRSDCMPAWCLRGLPALWARRTPRPVIARRALGPQWRSAAFRAADRLSGNFDRLSDSALHPSEACR